jgi:hypothetical protein
MISDYVVPATMIGAPFGAALVGFFGKYVFTLCRRDTPASAVFPRPEPVMSAKIPPSPRDVRLG